MSWNDLLEIHWDGGLQIQVGWITLVAIAVVVVALNVRVLRRLPSSFATVEINVPLGAGGSVKLRRTDEVVRIAHEAWTEIITRKAGLKFDPENDLIVEVYDSWYALFGELRSLTRSVPGSELRSSKDARKLIDLLVQVLNDGLRPHLTVHQARFRRWLELQTQTGDPDEDPQQVERRYPRYTELAEDLERVHSVLVGFAEELHRLAHGAAPDSRPSANRARNGQ